MKKPGQRMKNSTNEVPLDGPPAVVDGKAGKNPVKTDKKLEG